MDWSFSNELTNINRESSGCLCKQQHPGKCICSGWTLCMHVWQLSNDHFWYILIYSVLWQINLYPGYILWRAEVSHNHMACSNTTRSSIGPSWSLSIAPKYESNEPSTLPHWQSSPFRQLLHFLLIHWFTCSTTCQLYKLTMSTNIPFQQNLSHQWTTDISQLKTSLLPLLMASLYIYPTILLSYLFTDSTHPAHCLHGTLLVL